MRAEVYLHIEFRASGMGNRPFHKGEMTGHGPSLAHAQFMHACVYKQDHMYVLGCKKVMAGACSCLTWLGVMGPLPCARACLQLDAAKPLMSADTSQ